MMRPILIRSIPHTGTFFLFDHLFSQWRPAQDRSVLNNGEKALLHFQDLSPLPKGSYQIVVPLRHPVAVAQSWLERGLNLSNLVSQLSFLDSLSTCFFLPIDSKNREVYLEKLSKVVGVSLKTDWRKINSRPAYEAKYTNEVEAIESDFKHLIERYWG